jgi:hypothetical protein
MNTNEHQCVTRVTLSRSAGFQTCRVADFQIGGASEVVRSAGLETGLETRDTADLEVCATLAVPNPFVFIRVRSWFGS